MKGNHKKVIELEEWQGVAAGFLVRERTAGRPRAQRMALKQKQRRHEQAWAEDDQATALEEARKHAGRPLTEGLSFGKNFSAPRAIRPEQALVEDPLVGAGPMGAARGTGEAAGDAAGELPEHILLPLLAEEKAAYLAERDEARVRVEQVRTALIKDFAERSPYPKENDAEGPETIIEVPEELLGFEPDEIEIEEAERAYWQASEQVDAAVAAVGESRTAVEVLTKRGEGQEGRDKEDGREARKKRTQIMNAIFELEAQPPTTRIGAEIANLQRACTDHEAAEKRRQANAKLLKKQRHDNMEVQLQLTARDDERVREALEIVRQHKSVIDFLQAAKELDEELHQAMV